MLGKFGLVLLVVLFGACMFVAGAMAPPAWRQSIGAFGQRLPVSGGAMAVPAATAAAGKPGAPQAAASTGPASSGSTAPVAMDSLLVGAHVAAPVPAKGQPAYALQLGQFVRDADAEAMARQATTAAPGLPLSRIAGIDANGQTWTVLAIGRYVSPDDAQRDAARLQQALGLGDLPAIRLPEPAPSTKSGT